MTDSSLIKQAKQLIQAVSGKPLSIAERTQRAVELTALMIAEARRIETSAERRQQNQLARMMNDPKGKAFTTSMTDQCFRSDSSGRVANQLVYLLKKLGIPKYLSPLRRMQLRLFKYVGKCFSAVLVPLTRRLLRKETSTVILPGEPAELAKHMDQRRKDGVRINLNHLGEAILGEDEAKARLQTYLNDLENPHVEYISVKISTICSQINPVGWNRTLTTLAKRLSQLYRTAKKHTFTRADGSIVPKFVNLDMEEYRDLHFTVAVFCQVLDEPEFRQHQAGIVLQAYLPDTHVIQQQLTEWALRRVAKGDAPIKIRLVKGANLAMEKVDAALHEWHQAPYQDKIDVDANYKRMMIYALQPKHVNAVHMGIGSHNLFDIAFALLLRSEQKIERQVCFEMLEGMADPMRRVVQSLANDMLLYCPAATEADFQNAVAYLIRRLDENTAPQNFLRHAFQLQPGTAEWDAQVAQFAKSCDRIATVSNEPRRQQNRARAPEPLPMHQLFKNESDTDWSVNANRLWIQDIVQRWKKHTIPVIPVVVDGVESLVGQGQASAVDPSDTQQKRYTYTLANTKQVDSAIACAKRSEAQWAAIAPKERAKVFVNLAQALRRYRGDLIGAMMVSCAKTAVEADVEISEAIDFAEYYWRNRVELDMLTDIRWTAKGTVVVAPPWNFPASIPAGGVIAALATGNCVIFKPAREAVLIGWILAQLCWEAGVPKQVLQFLVCEDEPVGAALINDPRVNTVVLTGATATARLFLQRRPGLDLLAETGGKNSIIVTDMADRDLAVRDIVQSAFGHAGQKCSACSLAILEAKIYDDPRFRRQLRDAAASWLAGPAWDLATRMTPLVSPPGEALMRALTTLEPGEEWLLQPTVDAKNPRLWTPGIKLRVQPGTFTHLTELFGPVLGVMRAIDLDHAIQLANQVPYGLTAGIHTLDPREEAHWLRHIEAGNCYVNRGITGAIVQRQPFGGCKDSSFGRGAKAGGPNYLTQLMHAEQRALPTHVDELSCSVTAFDKLVRAQHPFNREQGALWQRSLGSYAFFWHYHFSKKHDPSLILGQDNFLLYQPQALTLRLQRSDRALDLLRVCAAALTCGTPLEVSGEDTAIKELLGSTHLPGLICISESEEQMVIRLRQRNAPVRLRVLSPLSDSTMRALGEMGARLLTAPVLANGRLELLNYVREIAQSIDYHRYGNVGLRENEKRAALVGAPVQCGDSPCGGCSEPNSKNCCK